MGGRKNYCFTRNWEIIKPIWRENKKIEKVIMGNKESRYYIKHVWFEEDKIMCKKNYYDDSP